jgi:hypothetical protein
MRVVIAGSRGITDYSVLKDAIAQSDFSITEVVSGCARGVDTLGERWAKEHGIPVKQFWPDWGRFGRAAGKYRNSEMAEYCDAGIILWDGESKGTLDMIDRMRRRRRRCLVCNELGQRVVAF